MDNKYWYCPCPRCNGQGRLVLMKDLRSDRLFFNCDECESSWYSADEIGSSHAFLGFNTDAVYASDEDISFFK